MKITGPLVIDVSMWNDHLNIQELVDGGVVSVILGLYKHWDGSKWVLNTNCKRIADQVAASSLILQTYYYFYPETDPQTEANWFINAMKPYPVKYAWADLEAFKFAMAPATRSERNRLFAAALHKAFPASGVYAAKWYVDAFAPDMNKWLGLYTAWVSHYGVQPIHATSMNWQDLKDHWLPNYNILLCPGQTKVVGHQFTGDKAILPGVYDALKKPMTLDVSVFKQEFLASLGTVPTPVPTPAPTPAYQNYSVVPAAINIRSAPVSQTSTFIRLAYHGEVLQVTPTPPQNGYVQLVDKSWAFSNYLAKC